MLKSPRFKFIFGGALILAAVIYLVVSSTQASAQYFMTVDELKGKGPDITGQNVRVSGAIIGDTISYDAKTLTLKFTVADVPADNNLIAQQGGLAAALHQAVVDPNRTHLEVVYNGPKPDMMRNEAQAIMTGHVGNDGVFYADELLLKCPSKYQDAVPQQVQGN